jgi:hypothetical protein
MAQHKTARVGMVRAWLERLAARLPATLSVDEVEDRIKLSLGTLTQLPADTFCDEALEAVAPHFSQFPWGAELTDRLRQWRTARFVAASARRDIPAWLAGLMGDTERARLAEDERHRVLREDWGAPGAVRQAVERCEGDERHLGVVRGLVMRWAPQNSDLVPPALEARPSGYDRSDLAPTPYYLSEAQLAAARRKIAHDNAKQPASNDRGPL